MIISYSKNSSLKRIAQALSKGYNGGMKKESTIDPKRKKKILKQFLAQGDDGRDMFLDEHEDLSKEEIAYVKRLQNMGDEDLDDQERGED